MKRNWRNPREEKQEWSKGFKTAMTFGVWLQEQSLLNVETTERDIMFLNT